MTQTFGNPFLEAFTMMATGIPGMGEQVKTLHFEENAIERERYAVGELKKKGLRIKVEDILKVRDTYFKIEEVKGSIAAAEAQTKNTILAVIEIAAKKPETFKALLLKTEKQGITKIKTHRNMKPVQMEKLLGNALTQKKAARKLRRKLNFA